MFCKWCGMESATTDVCSWCHRSLTGAVETERARSDEEASDSQAPAEEETSGEMRAPWTVAPPVPPPSPAPPEPIPVPAAAANGTEGGNRPIIGIKRPGGRGPAPAPAAPAQGARGEQPRMPAPPVPPPVGRVPAPPVALNRAGDTGRLPAPAMPPARAPHAPAPAAPIPLRTPVTPPVESVGKPPIAPAPVIAASAPPSAVADEPIGLAAGQSAPPRPTPAETNAPAFGTFTAEKSKYYTGQVVDPVSGTHYDSTTGKPTAVPGTVAPEKKPEDNIVLNWDQPEGERGVLIGRYAAAFGVVLLITGLWAHFMPNAYVVPLIIAQFLGAMLLPVLRVVPWPREEFDDAWLVALLLIVGSFALGLGPLVALIIYGVYALAIRQDVTAGAMGGLIAATISRVVMELAAGWSPLLLHPASGDSKWWPLLFVSLSALVIIPGWLAANMFHKLDE